VCQDRKASANLEVPIRAYVEKILGMKPADERMGMGVLVSAPGVGVDGDIGKLSSGGGGLRWW
jgi:hypothetical protein